MLCYSFIPLCCPLVLIMVASFKFQTDMLQKQSYPLYVPPLLVWDLVHGTKRAYICACTRVCVCVGYKSAFPSVCSLFLCTHPSVNLHMCMQFFFCLFNVFL